MGRLLLNYAIANLILGAPGKVNITGWTVASLDIDQAVPIFDHASISGGLVQKKQTRQTNFIIKRILFWQRSIH
ncbi:MAG: hypothetical protein CME32_30340 [Gimesia sp.]|nr:hypothetical protein [Gimesia sp.]